MHTPSGEVLLALCDERLGGELTRQLAEDGFEVARVADAAALAARVAHRPVGLVVVSASLPGLDGLRAADLGQVPVLAVVPHAAAAIPAVLRGSLLGVLLDPVDLDDVRTITWNTVR